MAPQSSVDPPLLNGPLAAVLFVDLSYQDRVIADRGRDSRHGHSVKLLLMRLKLRVCRAA